MMSGDLKHLIEENPDLFDVGAPVSPDVIAQAERFLDLEFPASFVEYLANWGTVAVGPLEFYGIAGTDFSNSRVPNGIWFTHVKRRQVGLPKPLVVIFNDEGDDFYCVDTDHPGGRVVVWDVSSRAIVSQKANNVCELILREASDYV